MDEYIKKEALIKAMQEDYSIRAQEKYKEEIYKGMYSKVYCDGIDDEFRSVLEIIENMPCFVKGEISTTLEVIKMTIDEKEIFSRIKEKYGYTDEQALIYLKGYEDCAEEHQQSLEKRDKMLKAAVEDLRWLTKWHDPCELCGLRDEDGDCPVDPDKGIDCDNIYKWRFEAEALKLIGEDEDET